MSNRDREIILRILGEMDLLQNFVRDMEFADFNNNELLKRAVSMTLINIGELARLLSADLKAQQKQIPFKEICATRNVAAHGYQTLRMDDIWDTVIIDIPIVYRQLKELL